MSNEEALRRKMEAQSILHRARAEEVASGRKAPVAWMTQPRFFNQGQPEGYSPLTCRRCAGTGTVGGSKCTMCAGHRRIYVLDEKK